MLDLDYRLRQLTRSALSVHQPKLDTAARAQITQKRVQTIVPSIVLPLPRTSEFVYRPHLALRRSEVIRGECNESRAS